MDISQLFLSSFWLKGVFNCIQNVAIIKQESMDDSSRVGCKVRYKYNRITCSGIQWLRLAQWKMDSPNTPRISPGRSWRVHLLLELYCKPSRNDHKVDSCLKVYDRHTRRYEDILEALSTSQKTTLPEKYSQLKRTVLQMAKRLSAKR